MDATTAALDRLAEFVGAVSGSAPRVGEALPDLRRLFADAGVPYRLVGGVAVVHHGYVRATDDLDVLVDASGLAALRPHLVAHGFVEESASRLRHAATGVAVDLLLSGSPMPRAGAGDYPPVDAVGGSPRDSTIADLAGLVALKLRAARHQDVADVVALLKLLDEGGFTHLEAQLDPSLRSALSDLRRDALEELSWSR